MIAKTFTLQEEIKNGKVTKRNGKMIETDGKKGRFIELKNGLIKYSKLNMGDIMKLISVPANKKSLENQLMVKIKPHHTRRKHRKRPKHYHHTARYLAKRKKTAPKTKKAGRMKRKHTSRRRRKR
jgi:hypothetical protein